MKKNILVNVLLACLVMFNGACTPLDFQTPSPNQTVESCPPCSNPIPQTNAEIRLWYNNQVVIIPTLTEQLIHEGASAKERAELAYAIRHRARIYARLLMPDKEEVEMLRKRDMEKYGNLDGPTFEYLVEKNRQKGLEGKAIYEAIVESSSRTSAKYNARFGIKRESDQ
ncbi:Lipoprotein [Candidatus Electrothrix laxa]